MPAAFSLADHGGVSTGRYHFGGWWVSGGGSGVGRMATVHEAWHDRLQFTTMYGLTVQHLWAVGDATGDDGWTRRGDDVLAGARRAHEEFASVMTEMTSGAALVSLRGEYPMYARHADRARQRAGASDPYTLLHRVNAIYRTCMQAADLADLVDRFDALSAAAIVRTARPDYRLGVLTDALARDGWPGAEADSDDGEATIQRYANEPDQVWAAASAAAYDWCAQLLAAAGCPTLPYEGQLGHVAVLNAAAVEAAGRPVRLIAMPASAAEESDVDVVLRAFESETLAFAQPSLRVVPSGTPLTDLMSGVSGREHLFVCIRPAGRLPSGYPGAPTGRHVVMIRSASRDGDQVEVALRELARDELDALVGTGIPVVASVSMLSLADASVRRDWAPLLAGGVCTVLVDLPLTRHLRLWTADAGASVRYGLGEYAVADRRGVCLGLRVETEAGASRLHVAVVSPSFAAALEVWLADTQEVSRRVVRDDGLLDEHEVLLSPTMGHLLVEEPFFDFKAGETGDGGAHH